MRRSPNDRRQTASQLSEARTLRSALEQIALLDERLGKGKGAVKERARLQAIVEHEKHHEKAKAAQTEEPELKKRFKKGKRRDKRK